LENPQKASLNAIRDAALYCYSMWAFMDADWLKKVAEAAASGKEMTADTIPRPETKKRSNIRTVYDGRYKYSRYFNSQEHNRPMTLEQIFEVNDVELFDLKHDPNEINNLVLDKKNQDLLLAMNDKLNRLIDTEVGEDDGSHLPDLEGVNWAFKRFDP
jgi:arylsulfatase